MPYMENHTLYYKKQCPFCQKVLRFMDDNKITMDTRDTLQSTGSTRVDETPNRR